MVMSKKREARTEIKKGKRSKNDAHQNHHPTDAVNNNGSIRVEGDFEIYAADGSKFDLAGRTAISLCRCGHSNKKPFCDSRIKPSVSSPK